MLCVRYYVISYMSDEFYIYNKLIVHLRHWNNKPFRSPSKCEATLEKSSNEIHVDCLQSSGEIFLRCEGLGAYHLCLEWNEASTGLLGGLIGISCGWRSLYDAWLYWRKLTPNLIGQSVKVGGCSLEGTTCTQNTIEDNVNWNFVLPSGTLLGGLQDSSSVSCGQV